MKILGEAKEYEYIICPVCKSKRNIIEAPTCMVCETEEVRERHRRIKKWKKQRTRFDFERFKK